MSEKEAKRDREKEAERQINIEQRDASIRGTERRKTEQQENGRVCGFVKEREKGRDREIARHPKHTICPNLLAQTSPSRRPFAAHTPHSSEPLPASTTTICC